MKTQLVILALAAVLLFAGCPRPSDYMPVEVDQEDEFYSDAESALKTRSYERALFLYNEYLSRYPRGRFAPSALMRKGEIYKRQRNYVSARYVYQTLINDYSNSVMVPDAEIEILVTHYLEGAYHEVISKAERVLSGIDTDARAYKVFVLTGDAYLAKGSPADAIGLYARAWHVAQYHFRQDVRTKLGEAVRQMSTSDISAALERTDDNMVRSHLMFQLGKNLAEEEKYEESIKALTDFTDVFPAHENAGQARDIIERLERIPAYNRYTIGCLLPLSGPYKKYGQKALRGIEIALANFGTVSGEPSVNIVIKDTRSDPRTAVRAVEEFANENVSSIIGPIITADPAAKKAEEKGIPIIVLTQKTGIPNIGGYVFRNYMTPRMQVNAVVAHAIEILGLKRFAILYPEEKYGTTYMDLFWDEVMSYGGKVMGVETYTPGQTDFSDPIKKLVGRFYKGGRSIVDFDAVFIPDVPDKVGLIIPQMAFYDVDNVWFLGTNLWHSGRLVRMADKFLEDNTMFPVGFHPGDQSPETVSFMRAYQDTFGDTPGFMESVAYDTAKLLFEIVRRPNNRYRSHIRDKLLRLRDFRGVTGLTSFDENGEASKKILLIGVKNRQFVLLGDI